VTPRRGFSLLEVLVATTVMGIAVVTLMSGLSVSVRNASRLTDYDRVALLARAKMDALLVDPTLVPSNVMEEPLDPSLLGGARGGWRAQITPFEAAPAPVAGALGLDRIQLEIWWMSGDRRRSFGLEAFRRTLPRKP
jgi:general secretion pathway protein I